MWQRRALEVTGELFIADGLVSIVAPAAHMRLWRDAIPVRLWRSAVQWLADVPGVTRVIGGGQIVLGAWLCRRAYRDLR